MLDVNNSDDQTAQTSKILPFLRLYQDYFQRFNKSGLSCALPIVLIRNRGQPMPRTKSVSPKQLAANRANTARSTGPKSEKGKATVSLNALRHGLTSQVVVLPTEDRSAYVNFCHGIVADFAPTDEIEHRLAQFVADDLWRLDRARAVETNMFAVGRIEAEPARDHDDDPEMHNALATARTFLDHASKFGLLSLYEQRIARSMHKNMEALRKIQAERRKTELATQQLATAKPQQVNKLQTATAQNGFVYSNNDFELTGTPKIVPDPRITVAAAA
jgi:hypothetical protein